MRSQARWTRLRGDTQGEEEMARREIAETDNDSWLDEYSIDIGGGTRAIENGSSRSLAEQPLDEDSQIVMFSSVQFYVSSFVRDVAAVLLALVTVGLACLVARWYPGLYPKIRFWKQVERGDEAADHVVITSLDGAVSVVDIEAYDAQTDRMVAVKQRRRHGKVPATVPRMFVWREERFWFSPSDGHWTRRAFNVGTTYGELHQIGAQAATVDSRQAGGPVSPSARRRLPYGRNVLRVRVPTFGQLLMAEILKPFFIFQVFSVTAWLVLDYATYACIIVVLTTFALFYAAYETWSNLMAVKRLAASETQVKRVQIRRETAMGRTTMTLTSGTVSSAELLPGDLVEVERGMVLPCDLVLLAGQCVVNEAMLTGESAPVLKSPLPPDTSPHSPVYQPTSEREAKFRLLSGTQIVQTKLPQAPPLPLPDHRPDSESPLLSIWQLAPFMPNGTLPVVAMVTGTAYTTAKGQLIRAILFPKPSKYDFERKLYYFVANLVVFLVVACTLIVVWQINTKSTFEILIEIINLVTITVPPQLPLALSISLSISFTRLQKQGIQCIGPARILAAGRVNLAAFDKTGTLTQDGLSLRGVCLVTRSFEGADHPLQMAPLEEDTALAHRRAMEALARMPPASVPAPHGTAQCQLALFRALAACHSISVLAGDDTASAGAGGPRGVTPGKGATSSADASVGRSRGWLSRLWVPAGTGRATAYQKQGSLELGGGGGRGGGGAFPHPRYIGDPLEIEAFSATGWRYLSRPDIGGSSPHPIWAHPHMQAAVDVVVVPPPEEDERYPSLGIVRRFDFDSELRMMSTVVVELDPKADPRAAPKIWLLTKGAPESVYEKCVRESVATNFEQQLQELALNGDRVLACGFRSLQESPIQEILGGSRREIERELILSGLLVMENRLKGESVGVLDELTRSGLRSVMVTGDNPLTAIAVARKCGPFFLRPECATFLLDAGPKVPMETEEDAEAAMATKCVLRNLATQQEYSLDNVLSPSPSTMAGSADVELGALDATPEVLNRREISLAVTGRAFDALISQHKTLKVVGEALYGTTANPRGGQGQASPLEMVLVRAGVFARMTPRNKLELMYHLQDLGYTVCMTGDGANDSSALKAADVGISIASSANEDNSVAAAPSIAAPFSTQIAHIGAVPQVLREGRCALVNATTMFKYMYFYALIQTTAVVILYDHEEDLAEYQYLYGDLFIVFLLILVLPGMRPSPHLSRGRPEGNLLAPPILASVYGQSVLLVGFQLLAYWFLQTQPWYFWDKAFAESTTGVYSHNQDATVMFLVSSFQYTTMAMALSQGFGLFRAPVLTNTPLCAMFCLQLITSTILILFPPSFALALFDMVDLRSHTDFLLWVWLIVVANGVLFVLFERYAIRHASAEPDPVDPTELPLLSASHMKKMEVKGPSLFAKSLPRFFAVQTVGDPFWRSLGSTSQA